MPAVPESYPLSPVIYDCPSKMHPLKAITMLSKPGIVSAEAMAGVAGMLLTSTILPSMTTAATGTACIVLAASGSALANSVMERGKDRMMPRLARRCQALEVSGSFKATAASVLLISLSLILAATKLNIVATILLMTAVSAYLFLYTLWFKVTSPWGVIAGAIPGALPPIIGSASVIGSVSAPALLLAAVIFVWQLPHFWFLALQYRDEYQLAGIPVLPSTNGERITKSLILTSITLLLPISMGLWAFGHCSGVYAVIAFISWMAFMIVSTNCMYRLPLFRKGYIASIAYLLVIVSTIIIDCYVQMNGNLLK